MKGIFLLKTDAAINLILGILLMAFPMNLVKALGLPSVYPAFYPSILGGVLFGIGLALLIESYRKSNGLSGLGLAGAIAINLCGGFILAIWLLFGNLNLPLRGQIFLWCLVLILVGLSLIEGIAQVHMRADK